MKKHFKRALFLLLAILLCIGMLPVSASAADLTGSMSMIDIKGRTTLEQQPACPIRRVRQRKYTMLRITDSSTGATKPLTAWSWESPHIIRSSISLRRLPSVFPRAEGAHQRRIDPGI